MRPDVPPPPPSHLGVEECNELEGLHAVHDLPSPPSSSDFHQQFLLSFGTAVHHELDEAIEVGSADRVLDELAATRDRHSDSHVTFNTAIEHAIKCKQLDMLRLLLNNGVPAQERNLEAATSCGHVAMVALLMEHLGWSVNKMFEDGRTLLTLAVGHEDLVAWLLLHGADPNTQDAWSETPLSRAAESGTEAVFNMLIEAGADVTQGAPVQMSLRRHEDNATLDFTERLLAIGAPVDKFEGENSPMWEQVGFQRATALHNACIKRNIPAIRLLLAYGADPTLSQRLHSCEVDDSSPLDEASSRGYADVVEILQRHLKGRAEPAKSNL